MNENREEDSFIRPQCCSRSLPPKLNVGSDDYVTFTNYKASSTPHGRMSDLMHWSLIIQTALFNYSAWDGCKLEIIDVFNTSYSAYEKSRKKSFAESYSSQLNTMVYIFSGILALSLYFLCYINYSRDLSFFLSLSSNNKMRYRFCCW